MHEYVVCFSTTGASIANDVRVFLDAADHQCLPFTPARKHRWESDDATVAFAGWEAEGDDPHVLVDNHGVVAISGIPRPRTGRWNGGRPLVEHVRDAVRSEDEFVGFHTVATLTRDGGEVWADQFGTASVYIGRTAEMVAVGNRSALVAGAVSAATGRPARRDISGSAFVAWAGYKLGRQTGFEDVEFVDLDHRVVAERGRVEVRAPMRHRLAAGPTEELSIEATIDEIVASLYFALDREDGRPVLELTGGKDSRLSLAVAMLAGLHTEFDVLTRGDPAGADGRLARIVAERTGVTRTEPTLTPRRLGFVDRLRAHVQRTDGLISAYENSHPDPDRRMTISSHAGEIMRGAPATDRDPTTLLEACRHFGWSPHGSVPYVRPELTHDYARELEELMLRGAAFSDDPADLVELFETNFRARWIGTRPHAGPPRVFSLLTLAGLRFAWSRGRDFRLSEPVHYPTVRRAGAGLLDAPLSKGEWNRDGAATRPLVSRERAPAKPPARHWLEQSATDLGAAVETLLRENFDSPAWEVIDRDLAMEHVSRYADLRLGERRQLLGAMTAAVWLNGAERGARDEWIG